jgi:methionyl aminopeptidase
MQPVDLQKMRAACKAAAATLHLAGSLLRVGMTTDDIDRIVREDTFRRGGRPAPYNYRGFPKSVCTSPNDVVCHGVPGPYVLKDGDIVNVDVTTILDGHYGDTNATFFVGTPSAEALRLVTEVTQPAMWAGIHQIKPGVLLGAVGRAIQELVEARGCSVVREFGGHGIGRRFHDRPHVNHFGRGTEGPILKEGMTFTVEPMVNAGGREVYVEADGWTVRTKDGSLSAQFEMTVLVTHDGYEVLTLP